MTIIKLAKKTYSFLLDSNYVEKSTRTRLDINKNDLYYNGKCTLVLGSTGVIGSKVIRKILEFITNAENSMDPRNYETNLILLKRKDTFLGKALYSYNEYNMIYKEVAREEVNFELEHSVEFIHSRFKAKDTDNSKILNIFEIVYEDSSKWDGILTKWKHQDVNTMLPEYKDLTGIVSCLGTTKSKLQNDALKNKKVSSQKEVDYDLNWAIIKSITNPFVKIVLLTSFNSFPLGGYIPYFKNKVNLEKDVTGMLEFKQVIIIRPGPYVVCNSNYDILSKYVSSDLVDYRSFLSQIIAYNFYKTQLSRFFGYCVRASDVVNTIVTALFFEGFGEKDNTVVYLNSKSMI